VPEVFTSRPSGLAVAARRLAPLLAFLVAWAFLDTLINLHYPGDEPTFWYPLPAIDVMVLLAAILLARRRGWLVPGGVRLALVVLLVVVRIFRCAEGVVERHFHRPLNLYLDIPLIPSLTGLLRSTVSRRWLVGGILLAVIGIGLVGVLTWHALRVAERALAGRDAPRLFGATVLVCAALWPLWSPRHDPHLHHGLFGASVVPRLARELSFLRHAEEYRREKAAGLARVQAELARTPHDLDLLHGADVMLILVESYGETVFANPPFARRMVPVLDQFQRDLGARGFHMASSLLLSPTYGGRSWLAHGTLAAGVRIEDGLAYTMLLDARPQPLTLAACFQRAGYRTALVLPANSTRWPEGEVTGFQQRYYAMDLDYHGPSFKWATMPDQYVLDYVHRHVVARQPDAPARGPLFVQYALVSSHSPWSVQPRVVADWDQLDGGRIYNRQEPVRYPVTWSNLTNGGEAYVTSLIYDFEVLRRYVGERVAGGALVIILGDHQPSAEVTGDDPSYAVPIHVVSRDRALIERFASAGYAPGMQPRRGPGAPAPLPMERFLPVFVRLFSTAR
jgi:hypothetical protein